MLLEDIDAAFPKRRGGGSSGSSSGNSSRKGAHVPSFLNSEVTFSGLLNTLDGVVSRSGQV